MRSREEEEDAKAEVRQSQQVTRPRSGNHIIALKHSRDPFEHSRVRLSELRSCLITAFASSAVPSTESSTVSILSLQLMDETNLKSCLAKAADRVHASSGCAQACLQVRLVHQLQNLKKKLLLLLDVY